MREDDEPTVAARHNELRDIHHRIDALKEEGERQYASLTEKLHALEVAIARGGRFPPAAWVAAVGLAMSVVGTGAVLYGELAVTQRIAREASEAIKAHIVEMGPAEAAVWKMDERVKGLESRIVGQGPDGWHRRDHETYSKMVEAQIGGLERRLGTVEAAQAALCQRVSSCKAGAR